MPSFVTRYDSTFSLEILSVLRAGDSYGYEIQKRIQQASDGRVQIRPSTLYRLLQTLEKQKAVKSWWDESSGRRRKWYRLTPVGQRLLERQKARWMEHVECLGQLLAPDKAAPQTERAG